MNFQEAGAIHQLLCHSFPRGRRDLSIAVPQIFKRPVQSIDCCTTISQVAGMIPIAVPQFYKWLTIPHCWAAIFEEVPTIPKLPRRNFQGAGTIPDCRATIFQEAGGIPDCCAAILQEADVIPNCRSDFSRVQCDSQLPRRNLFSARLDPLIAAPRSIFQLVRSPDCLAAIFLANFSFGKWDPLIATPGFFGLRGWKMIFDSCTGPFVPIAQRPTL